MRTWLIAAAVSALGGACAPEIESNSASSFGAGGASPSTSVGPGSGGEAGWTACSAPDGSRICGGKHHCNADCGCDDARCDCGLFDDSLGACETSLLDVFPPCPDGSIAISEAAKGFPYHCYPYDMGVLFAQNGGTDQVRYADYGLWTGDPLPEPTDCPAIPGVLTCGGHCGDCPEGQTCTGRAPLHPYGICIHGDLPLCASGSLQQPDHLCAKDTEGCFVFMVQTEGQDLADYYGYCFPLDECQATAAKLPGGGKCITKNGG